MINKKLMRLVAILLPKFHPGLYRGKSSGIGERQKEEREEGCMGWGKNLLLRDHSQDKE